VFGGSDWADYEQPKEMSMAVTLASEKVSSRWMEAVKVRGRILARWLEPLDVARKPSGSSSGRSL